MSQNLSFIVFFTVAKLLAVTSSLYFSHDKNGLFYSLSACHETKFYFKPKLKNCLLTLEFLLQ